jgi:hypothetical protein
MNKIVKFIIILFGLYLIIRLIKSQTCEHFYLYGRYNNVYDVPDDLVKRHWQKYPLDRTVEMNY